MIGIDKQLEIIEKDISPAVAAIVLDVAQGATLARACENHGITQLYFLGCVKKNTVLTEVFSRARESGAEVLADSLIHAHEDVPDVAKARLYSDNIKWLLARRHAATYGDRLEINTNVTVDISGAMAAARARMRPICDLEQPTIELAPVISSTCDSTASDFKSEDHDTELARLLS